MTNKTHETLSSVFLDDLLGYQRLVFDEEMKNSTTPVYKYNIVYETNDKVLIVSKHKFTIEEFEKFAAEVNVHNWEPVEFTGEPI